MNFATRAAFGHPGTARIGRMPVFDRELRMLDQIESALWTMPPPSSSELRSPGPVCWADHNGEPVRSQSVTFAGSTATSLNAPGRKAIGAVTDPLSIFAGKPRRQQRSRQSPYPG